MSYLLLIAFERLQFGELAINSDQNKELMACQGKVKIKGDFPPKKLLLKYISAVYSNNNL